MTYHAKVVSGQIVLPPELRRDAGIEDGDSLVIELNPDGGLTMKTYAQVVREVQSEFRSMAKPADRNLVDELLADRRADAVRENTEIEDWRTRHTA
ncbi:antidote-toxin recognition antitoxin MazE [Sphingomonas sp. PP-CE-3G-477]|uniref:AbrB/MazE/SpoVT family DNA-binding domain-containing protein n=1 Tax=Sphingomonas sp. PP-CE-3G-477 TaxID=2135660 RepID=UPI000D38CAC5|nr:AbrB/MazE/SpoVT family DNA-binding domain-containing protein [Sphingomonas sp. PP-CE-3G-477]PTQ63655.1 antidote-toxin recognition antitoxin MazE [Sphingomonas sp. PP-CE-3G-477]